PAVVLEKSVIDEVMVFQPREGAREVCGAIAAGSVVADRGQRVLPTRPGTRKARFRGKVTREQAPGIGADQISTLGLGDHVGEAAPDIRPEGARATAIEPVQLSP